MPGVKSVLVLRPWLSTCDQGLSDPRHVVNSGVRAEAWVSWFLTSGALAQAGNGAGKTHSRCQWKDCRPEAVLVSMGYDKGW